jgi:hypothetical protein
MSFFVDIANTMDAGSPGELYSNACEFGHGGTQFFDPTLIDDFYSDELLDPVPLDLGLNIDSTLLPFGDTLTPGQIDFPKFSSFDASAPTSDDFCGPIADDDGHFYIPAPKQSPVAEQFDPAPEVTATPVVIYAPITIDDLATSEQNLAATPVVAPRYPAYQGKFQSREAAKAHRKKSRRDRKRDPNVVYVRKYGRQYWVERIYNSMINIDQLEDSAKSTHRERFVKKVAFEPDDLEATAHHVFVNMNRSLMLILSECVLTSCVQDKALAVHEKGWTRYTIYHKNAVRGALVDNSANNVELRLQRICQILRGNKSLVNDALQGGLTLAQLCDNPYLRSGTKTQNNKGNKVRSKRLQAGREVLKDAAAQSKTSSGANAVDE